MKLYIVLVLCFFTSGAIAAKKAITEEGSVVILADDGTWHYESDSRPEEAKIPVNPKAFIFSPDSNFTIKSQKTNATFAIDAKKWAFKKGENEHEAAEYTFKMRNADLYGMAITEQVEISIEELVKIAFMNAQNVAPDARVVKKEYRQVNGLEVIYMEIVGTIQSINFKYLGYYYSNASGSTQYMTYTGINLVEKYQTDIENFLNGFSVSP